MTAFAELAVTTNFGFLRGASHPEELVEAARELGLAAIAVADRNSLAGVVRAHVAAREKPELEGRAGERFPYRVGCRLVFVDGTPDILAWPRDRAAYGRLCRLLTLGNRRGKKGECILARDDLLGLGAGMVLGLMPPRRPDAATEATLGALREAFPGAVRLVATMGYGPGDHRRLALLRDCSARFGVPLLASNDVLYHDRLRRPLQDVLTCIREHVTLTTAGRLLLANAERHLKPADEMARLFRDAPEAIAESLNVLEELSFSLDQLSYLYPDEPVGAADTGGRNPDEVLAVLTARGAAIRYPDGPPAKVKAQIDHELALIAELKYAPYFLTVHDIVRFARGRGILCQGRGSAANSTVCYCLGITDVSPELTDLLFERFISAERKEPPDIDVDFEHERREEVMQYIYDTYSRDRAGIAATVITYRSRSAVREVGKVFGLSEDTIGALSGSIWGWSNEGIARTDAARAGLDPESDTMRQVLRYSREIIGFPRHLSQHVGGFVITRDRLDESVPIGNAAMEGRTFVEWDKDDLDALHILKIDVLALGMLSCIRRAFTFLAERYDRPLALASIPKEDPAVYRMLQRADSLGTFQVESRAQMTMLPRLKPEKFYDLVIEVAIVRPGPIQGDMVHPYLRRRQGIEKVEYPSPAPQFGPQDELKQVLDRTLGVPLFQEQAMRIAIVAAGFRPGEADKLRRAMATFRRSGTIQFFRDKFVEGMVGRGYPRDFAERAFRQIEGFGEYGFPESHAASFALLVYASAWLKCHYPDVFCAALLNAQPMGFYAPAQIVRDAREHGVNVLPVDVNRSGWDCALEPEGAGAHAAARIAPAHAGMKDDILTSHAVRLGFRQMKGFPETDAQRLMAARGAGYDSVRDLWLRSGLTRAAIERLADADAFRSLGLDRRGALWAARALAAGGARTRLPLFDAAPAGNPAAGAIAADGSLAAGDGDGRAVGGEPEMALPAMPLGEQVVNDYRFLSLSLKAHPVAFLRRRLAAEGILENRGLAAVPNGRRATVAGLVLVRQRPGTASGVIFATIEDETGIANIIVWPKVFEVFRPVVLGSRLVKVTGRVQSESGVIHVVAERLEDRSPLLSLLADGGAELEALARADQPRRGEETHADGRGRKKGARPAQEMPADLLSGLPPGEARPVPAASDPPPPPGGDLAPSVRRGGAAAVMPKGRNFH